jgi:hypothetical protein
MTNPTQAAKFADGKEIIIQAWPPLDKPAVLPYSSTVEQNQHDGSGQHIHWHPAFVEALQKELEAYQDSLEFYPEFQLTAEPLRIDCVVVKKKKGVQIKKNIAAIFRACNLLEYKSPDDYISVEDFYKVYGYACLYASLEKAPITDLTITFIESRYPEKLLEHLKNIRGYTVEETGHGIYNIEGDVLPIQIIDNRHLPEEENRWLKNLSNRLGVAELSRMYAEISRIDKAAKIAAYLDAIMRANAGTLKEVIKMSDAAITLEQVFEEAGWTAKWEARGKAEGEELGALKIAKNMIKQGYSFEAIVSSTQLDPEKVKALYQ